MNKTKLINRIVEIRYRIGRGKSYYSEFNGVIMMVIALKVYDIPLWVILPIVVFGHIALYYIGYYDQKKIKMWQREAVYGSKDVNPFFAGMDKKLDKVLKSVRR